MNITKRLPFGCALSLLAACGGVISWESVCGCVPATVGLAGDLGVEPNTEFIPDALVTIVDDRLSPDKKPVDLEVVRSLGYAFDRNCHDRPNFRIRCTFWLWSHGEMNRGIELNLQESTPRIRDPQLSARYVYEAQGR